MFYIVWKIEGLLWPYYKECLSGELKKNIYSIVTLAEV